MRRPQFVPTSVPGQVNALVVRILACERIIDCRCFQNCFPQSPQNAAQPSIGERSGRGLQPDKGRLQPVGRFEVDASLRSPLTTSSPRLHLFAGHVNGKSQAGSAQSSALLVVELLSAVRCARRLLGRGHRVAALLVSTLPAVPPAEHAAAETGEVHLCGSATRRPSTEAERGANRGRGRAAARASVGDRLTHSRWPGVGFRHATLTLR